MSRFRCVRPPVAPPPSPPALPLDALVWHARPKGPKTPCGSIDNPPRALWMGFVVRVQPTTYGELAPPLGTLRLKIVEFLSVLVRAVVTTQPALTESLQVELLRLDALYKCLNLFFEVSHEPTTRPLAAPDVCCISLADCFTVAD
jgi:hypothetical protein